MGRQLQTMTMKNLLAQLLVDGQRAQPPISAVVETKSRVQDILKEATEAYMKVIQQTIASNMIQHTRNTCQKKHLPLLSNQEKKRMGFQRVILQLIVSQ